MDVTVDTSPRTSRQSRDPLAAARRLSSVVAPAAAVIAVQLIWFPVPLGVWLQGAVLGLLDALVVLGLILVYRANRVINLAQASIGTYPATLAGAVVLFGAPSLVAADLVGVGAGLVALLGARSILRLPWTRAGGVAVIVTAVVALGLPRAGGAGWWGGLAVGLVAAVLSGVAIDAIVIRRLRTSPRLVVTVATIGLAQYFVVNGLLTPRLWGKVALVDPRGDRTGFEVPGRFTITVGSTVFHSAEVVAVVVSLLCIAVVSAVLRWTDVGMAVRASAERADRASMLGIPVPRIEAGVWIVAAVLAFVSTYLHAGILGLEVTSGIGLRVMVAALGAMALGGFTSAPAMLLSAVAIGVLAQATGPAGNHSLTLTDAVLAGVVVVGLLARRVSHRRADRDATSSWQAAAEPRAVPFELAHLPVLRWARGLGVVTLVAVGAALPLVLSESQVLRGSSVIALVVLALSVVVLTGWTGEVTLGQMSFAATGAAVAAYATLQWRADLSLCLLLGGLAAAVVAVLVALPSLRRPGLFLAVTTLAFALASNNYLLNPTIATWIPTEDVVRRPLLGTFGLAGRTAMYELAFAVMVASFAAVAGIRRTRVGRILRAVRDNRSAAQADGVRVPLARLGAFALSGFLAGTAGVLLFAVNERYEVALFSPTEGLNVFISAVVGGVGSSVGALLGAVVVDGSRSFLSGPAGLLPSAVGVLAVLLLLPGGLADLVYRLRDRVLRALAARRGIHVPSLVADGRVTAGHDRQGTDRPSAGDTALAPLGSGPPALPAEAGWLSVRDLDVAYDRVQVLFGVSIDIPEGQITALLGTNGAGKSTLLRAIGGVAPIIGGTIRLGEVDVVALRPEQVPAHGIVQMPGGHGVFPSLTIDENLRVAAWLFRRDRADAAERIARARSRFPVLEARRHHPAADLSGGQQQQLALAMALLARPRLLLVDELSLGLAPVMVAGLLQELRDLRDQGTTIVVVEQSVNVALTVADHAYFMEKGEIRFSGPAAQLLDQPDLVRAVYLQGARDALGSAPVDPAVLAGAGAGLEPSPNGSVAAAPVAAGGSARAAALEVRDLAVAFDGIAAVDGVDLAVAPGEVVGLIGPNGAGKTTVFDLVSGFTAADRGRILLHGHDLTSIPPSARARAGLGRSFQDAKLFAGLTVAETIAVSLERWIQGDDAVGGAFRLPASRAAERHVSERVGELIEQFGLGAFRSKRVGDLSTGSRRMVDLACVVAHRPSVVLLDEPTSGIAQREAEALGPLLLGLRDRLGCSLLVIEHDISLISSVADRLVALDQGAVVAVGRPVDVLDHPAVVASYLGSGAETLKRSDHVAGGAR